MIRTLIILSFTASSLLGQNYLIPQPQKANFSKEKIFIGYSDSLWQKIEIKVAHPFMESFQIDHNNILVSVELGDFNLQNDEAYKLKIEEKKIEIKVQNRKGAYYALQTLKQLGEDNHWPICQIEDWPAYRIRGFMHDVGRSFIPIEELKEQIKILSGYKINVFHWHLTEDLAWRLESKLYPALTLDENFERFTGRYYSREDVMDLLDFATRHFVTMIPEIDMPGHSASFERAFGFKMQSDSGKIILKEILKEAGALFKGQPYFHIGTDEVNFSDPDFVPEMVTLLRSLGFKVASWNPGWNYKMGEIDLLQLWSYRGKPVSGIPYVDSKFHYINHFDSYADLVSLYKSKLSEDTLLYGSILATWNDRKLTDSWQILNENSFYPLMLTFAEKMWKGGGEAYFDQLDPTLDPKDSAWIDFENRLIFHRDSYFEGKPFPYFRQSSLKWWISPPMPNEGNLEKEFIDEKKWIREGYIPEDFNSAFGAGIYMRHVWGNLVPGWLSDPQPNHTIFTTMKFFSPVDQDAFVHVSFQNYGRSEKDLPPPQGEWDWKKSRIWWNRIPLNSPRWINKHKIKDSEVELTNENWTSRAPIPVKINKGWNYVWLKLPVGNFTTEEVRLVKWMFNFNMVGKDGKEIHHLIFE